MSEDVSAGRLSLEVVADTTGLRADLKAKVDAVSAQIKAQVKAQLQLDAQQAKAAIDAATRDRVVTLKANADTAQAKTDLDKAAADRTATIKAKADTAQARTDLDALAKTRTTTVKAKADTSALSQIESIGGKVSAALGPVAMASGLVTAVGAAGQLAGALVAVTAAASQAAGVAGALPGLFLTAAQGAGSLVLGFSGISKAVSAYQSAQSSAGTSAVQSAQQTRAAQDQVRTSAQALANAQIDGAEQVAQAQHSVQQSVIAVSDAQYNAAQSVGSALHSQQQAVIGLSDAQYQASQDIVTSEHSYTDALYSEQQAQIALTQARAAARQNLIQTSFDLRDAVLGEQQAALSLSESKTTLQQTLQSAASTSDQKTQAQLDEQQAQLAYDESVNKAQQASKAKQAADKAGVAGSQGVVQAKHDEQDATFSAGQADQAVARARVEAARSIKEAQFELTQAVQQYSRSQVLAVRSVQDAEYQEKQSVQSLADTQRTSAQQLKNAQIGYSEAVRAAKSPLVGLSSAQTGLNAAMAKLTPQGRALVSFITGSIIPAYNSMQKSVAGALLPGVTSGLKSALPVIGTVSKGLTGTGKVLGGVASRFGSFAGSAGVQSDLSGIMATNTKAIGLFGDAALHVVDALRNVTVVAEPLVTKVSQWADHIAKVADSLSKSGRESGSMAAFFDRAWKSASQLYDIGKNLLGTLLHIFGAAAPSGTSLLGSLVTATDKLDKWTGSSGGQAKLQQFFSNTVPVARQFGDLLNRAAGVLGKLVSGFGGGELDGLFTVLNLALTVLSTLTNLPGFGQVVQWVLLLSGVGVGLGKVASNITSIGKGLSALTKFSGLDKVTKALGLGDTVGGALGAGAKKVGGAILGQKAVGDTISDDGELIAGHSATGARAVASSAGQWLSAAGQGAASMAGQLKTALAKEASYLKGAAQDAKGFATTFGSNMASAAGSAVSFVAGLGKQLVTGAKSLAVFVGEQAVAGGTYIAENVAMAASATAAFIAENLATLGIVAALALIVTAIVYVATHWSQVWGEIKKVGGDAWHWIDGNIVQPVVGAFGHDGVIGTAIGWVEAKWSEVWTNLKKWASDAWNFIYNGIGKYLLVLLGPAGLIVLGIIEVSKHWGTIWADIKATVKTVTNDISKIIGDFVSGVKGTWAKLEGYFKDPVKFIVNTVYDDGIATLWNDVAGPLHMPKLPKIKMRSGGPVPGTGSGDHVPILGEPGEWMLSKKQVAGTFGGGSLERGHAVLTALFGQGSTGPGYSGGGGILGDITGFASDVGHGIATGAKDALNTASFVAQVVADPAGALKQYLAGPLGKLGSITNSPFGAMVKQIPVTLAGDLIAKVKSALGLGDSPAGSGGNVKPPTITGSVKDWFTKAVQVTGVPASWIPSLEIIGQYESSENPLAQNNVDSNAAAGNPSKGIMQTISSTFSAFHQKGTSWNIWDPVANIAAAINYILSRYGNVSNVPGIKSLAQGKGYVGYDTGGPLKPGLTSVVNATGRDEWVLTPRAVDLLGGPRQVAALNSTAGHLYAAGSVQAASAVAPARTAAGGSPTVNVYPQQGQSEETIGDIAARRLGFMLG